MSYLFIKEDAGDGTEQGLYLADTKDYTLAIRQLAAYGESVGWSDNPGDYLYDIGEGSITVVDVGAAYDLKNVDPVTVKADYTSVGNTTEPEGQGSLLRCDRCAYQATIVPGEEWEDGDESDVSTEITRMWYEQHPNCNR